MLIMGSFAKKHSWRHKTEAKNILLKIKSYE